MRVLTSLKQLAGLIALGLLAIRWLVPGSSLEKDLGGGALLATGFWLVLQVGGLAYRFFRPAPLQPRPRHAGRLVAPSTFRQSRPVLLAWGFPWLVLWSTTASEQDAVVILMFLFSALLIPFIYNLIAPGPARARQLFGLQLASLVEVNVPLPAALELFSQQAAHQLSTRFSPYPTVLAWLAFDLRSGSLLSAALSRHSYFPPVWASLVRMGEQTQTLSQSLRALSRMESFSSQRSHLLRPALLLPVILMLHAFLQLGVFHLARLLAPARLMPTWLPAYSYSNGMVALGLFLAATVLLYRAGRVPLRVRGWVTRAPWLWPLVRLEQQWMGLQALYAGARAGYSQEDMLRMAQEACTQPDYQRAFDPKLASSGSSLEQILSQHGRLFEAEILSLVAFGEQSQHLTEALSDCCQILEQRLLEQHAESQRLLVLGLQVMAGAMVAINGLYFLLPSCFYSLEILSQSVLP